MQDPLTIWLPRRIFDRSYEDAGLHYPFESGGAFMGYWAESRQVVIKAMIEGGPGAIRKRFSFEPDYDWQQAKIEEHYYASARYETYLGDWHSHPNGFSGHLSHVDKRALRRVATAESARAPRPLSLIFYGKPDSWKVAGWYAEIVPRKFFGTRLKTGEADLRIFDD